MIKLISVIIPMFNAEDTILDSINSVLNQTYKKSKIEILVIDDGSEDGSFYIVKEFIKKNECENVKLLSKKNGGVSSARNMGIKNAKGNYIAFLDSDDIWKTDKLKKQMEILEKNKKIDFLGCNRNNENTKVIFKKFDKLKEINFTDLLIKIFPQTSTVIIKKEVFNEVGLYDENQSYAEDANLWLRIAAEKKCYMMPESLVITGNGKPNFGYEGLSSNLWEMEKGELKNIRDIYKLGYISVITKYLLYLYSILKYIRREFIVKIIR